jgi:hypothetical protein
MEALKKLLSSGNMKLPKSTAIFNLCAATDCPSKKLGLCQAIDSKTGKVICYALKAERLYPPVLPYRRKQEVYWKSVTAEDFVRDFLAINAKKRNKYQALRINEAGDFVTQKDVAKVDKIAELLQGVVKVYTYTARKDLDYSKVKYLVINGSGFKTPGIAGFFNYIEKGQEIPTGFKECVGDCRICARCQHGANTVVLRH